MGRSVICSCGQRNVIDGYQFGEAPQCLSCGRLLPMGTSGYKAEEFVPVVTDFEFAPSEQFGSANEFESPSAVAAEPAAPTPAIRAWQGGVREGVSAPDVSSSCAGCGRAFRGAWDLHTRPKGNFCHICATQAEKDYVKPEDWLRRELYRPVPPRKLNAAPDPTAEEVALKKRKEVILLAIVGAVTLILINLLPVERWMALLFASDLDKAADLPSAWYWAIKAVNIAVSILSQGVVLYAALSWTRLAYEGGLAENWPTLAYLSVVFAVLNELVALAAKYFVVLGPAAGILTGMAAVVTLYIKMMMIAERYSLRMESGISFFLSWALCSLLLWPCTLAIHQLVQGIVAAIAL